MPGKRLAVDPRLASALLNGLILFRVTAALPLFLLIHAGHDAGALLLLLIAVTTDWLDGQVARWLGAGRALHPFADAIADFVLVMASFAAFVLLHVYPIWTLIIFVTVFAQFILTSRLDRPIYDPVGKYWGVFLFAMLGITLAIPQPVVFTGVLVSVLLFTCAAIVSRIQYLLKRRQIIAKPSTASSTGIA